MPCYESRCHQSFCTLRAVGFLLLFAQVYWCRDKLDHKLKEAEGQYPVLLHLSFKIVVFSKIQYRILIIRGHRSLSWHKLIISRSVPFLVSNSSHQTESAIEVLYKDQVLLGCLSASCIGGRGYTCQFFSRKMRDIFRRRLPKIAEDFGRLPKIAECFQRLPKIYRRLPKITEAVERFSTTSKLPTNLEHYLRVLKMF